MESAEVEQAIKMEQKLNFGPTMIQAVFKKFSKGEISITFEQYLQIVTFLTNLSKYRYFVWRVSYFFGHTWSLTAYFLVEKQFELTDTDLDGRITVTLDQLVEIVAKI